MRIFRPKSGVSCGTIFHMCTKCTVLAANRAHPCHQYYLHIYIYTYLSLILRLGELRRRQKRSELQFFQTQLITYWVLLVSSVGSESCSPYHQYICISMHDQMNEMETKLAKLQVLNLTCFYYLLGTCW